MKIVLDDFGIATQSIEINGDHYVIFVCDKTKRMRIYSSQDSSHQKLTQLAAIDLEKKALCSISNI